MNSYYIHNLLQKYLSIYMNTNRLLLFLIGCIGTRLLFVYIAKNISKPFLVYMGYIGLIIGLGFLTIYVTGIRNTGLGAFGEKIWWNDLRPVHGILYLLFAYNAINGNQNIAWKLLAVDVIIGLFSFLWFYFNIYI